MTIVVTVPAADRSLVKFEEVKLALGFQNTHDQVTIEALILRVSDMISRHCGVADDGEHPPTLLREEIVETVWPQAYGDRLLLSRRFLGTVSVVEMGSALVADDFLINRGTGALTRLSGGNAGSWSCGKTVITYQAGFETPPEDLKQAAIMAVRDFLSMKRDPSLRSESIDGIGRWDYQTAGFGSTTPTGLSAQVLGMIAPFRSIWV